MSSEENYHIISQNKKATHDYFVQEEYEAGIVLSGSEVKSLRLNGANLRDSHADVIVRDGVEELYLMNFHIPEYKNAGNFNHKPNRNRKLLLHKREIKKLLGKKEQKGFTLIALVIYFNHKGYVKLKLGLCKGKTKYDKRESLKQKDWNRQKQRELKNNF